MNGYPLSIPYSVRLSDINYAGHVGNPSILNFFQDARIAYLAAIGPYSELDIGEECATRVLEAHVRYLAELFHGEALEIGVRIGELQETRFVMNYRIDRNGRPAAEGTTTVGCFRHGTPVPPPEAFREAVTRFEGTAQDS